MEDAEHKVSGHIFLSALPLMAARGVYAQQTFAQQTTEKRPVIETPAMRLAVARNVFIIRTHGGRVPVEVISSTIEGLGALHAGSNAG